MSERCVWVRERRMKPDGAWVPVEMIRDGVVDDDLLEGFKRSIDEWNRRSVRTELRLAKYVRAKEGE